MSDANNSNELSKEIGDKHVALSQQDISNTLRLLAEFLDRQPDKSNVGPTTLEGAGEGSVAERSDESSSQSRVSLARAVLLGRKIRGSFFKSPMFGEPAWDMLLALFVTEGSEKQLTVSRLSEFSGAPMSTALRWLDYLEQSQLVTRGSSTTDKRVVYVKLTDTGREALHEYFSVVTYGI